MSDFEIILPELTKEALERLLSDKGLSLFLNEDSKNIIRKKFKEKCKQEQSK